MLKEVHRGTLTFVRDLVNHQGLASPSRPKLIAGSYLPELEEARSLTRQRLADQYGMGFPETAGRAAYTLPETEESKLNELMLDWHSRQPPEQAARILGIEPGTYSTIAIANLIATERLRTYQDVCGYETLRPDMRLRLLLEAVPPLQNTENHKDGIGVNSRGCVVTTFGMNAVYLAGEDKSPGAAFDSKTALEEIETNWKAPEGAPYDLPWLLRLLTSQFAEKLTEHRIRTVTSVGADFGEIEEKVLLPLREKNDTLKFMVNVVMASARNVKANHAANILRSTDTAVEIQDPIHGATLSMPADSFWKRWVSANMQAVIVVAQPL